LSETEACSNRVSTATSVRAVRLWYTAPIKQKAKTMTDKSEIQELYEFMRNNLATKSDLEGLATKEDVADIKKTLDDHTEILNEHTETLDDHTRRLNRIETDVKYNLDKRLQLEVRIKKVEEEVGL
jgi:hypothetical protein